MRGILSLGLALLFVFTGCRPSATAVRSAPASEDNTVRLAIQTWAGYAFAFIGVEKGFFEDLKIEQLIMDDNNARFPAFQAGAVDVLMEATTNITFEYEKGILGQGKVIAITDHSQGADGMLVRPDIHSVRELKGKHVAYVRTTTAQIILYRALNDIGLSMKDIGEVLER